MVALGDFNAKSNNWYSEDITSNEGRKIEAVIPQNGLHQEINEPAHILDNSSSCIVLIFNSQPILLIEAGFTHLYTQVVIIKQSLQNLT